MDAGQGGVFSPICCSVSGYGQFIKEIIMIKHTAIKAGIGIGLMAASLGAASADLHTFGKASIYYKIDGSAVKYSAFVPSGPTATDSVIMLDMLQSGTVSTWAYAMGAALGTLVNTVGGTSVTNTSHYSNFSNAAGGLAWKAAATVTYVKADGNTASSASTSFYNGDTAQLVLSFSQVPTISSQACNMSFSAQLDTDDYLKFTNVVIRPENWPSATDSVSYRTKSGTTASDTLSIASNVFNAYNATTTSAFATFTAWSVPIAGNAGNTVAVSALSAPFGKCVTAATARTAVNAASSVPIIGGGSVGGGMLRLW